MRELDEFEVIARYFTRQARSPEVLLGIGDDAAVIDVAKPLAVAVDTLVEGVHFPAALSAHALGHRILAVNLSDLAAMGATPRWATLALSMPDAQPAWLEQLAAGLFALAEAHKVELIGGDTVRGPLTLTLQALGTLRVGPGLRRAAGQVDDDIYVTGNLGDAAAGLAVLQDELDAGEWVEPLVRRFAYPTPRVRMGQALSEVAHAAIDISDGLLADLGHVTSQSGCAAIVAVDRLPLSEALTNAVGVERARELALTGGDDYELCFTAAREQREAVGSAARASGVSLARIGQLRAGSGIGLKLGEAAFAAPRSSFRHFRA